jgi:putative transposase
MSRHRRVSPDGYVQHVLNRANDRKLLFPQGDDYLRFLSLMRKTAERVDIDLFAYILMPTHFHFVLRAPCGEDVSAYMRLLLNGHVRQHQRIHNTIGRGHLYQGRFKNFVVGDARYLLNVLRYVENNALRATLVTNASDWPWSSASRLAGHPERPPLSEWPLPRTSFWTEYIQAVMPQDDLDRVRLSVRRGRPYGNDDWVRGICKTLGLEHTLNEAHRPAQGAKILDSVEIIGA